MRLETFFEKFDQFAELPDSVAKMRKLVRQLAVTGKLVAQNLNDEPASQLLERIATHKADLAGSGAVRASAPVASMADGEGTFELPSNWIWVRFGEIMVNRDGERVPVSKEERASKAKNYDYYGASGVIDRIDGYLFDKPLLLIGEDGANLINRATPIAFMARGRYWVNNHAHVLDGISEEFLRFIELQINAINLEPYVTGSAQPKMNQTKMNSIPIALPPLPEQKRIVAKVDELMALCDQLEAQQQERQTRHAALARASLARFADAPTLANLEFMFHDGYGIEPADLRRAVLALAVRGQLVPQCARDGDARTLIDSAMDERQQTIKTKGLRNKDLDEAVDLIPGEDLPSSWCVERLANLVDPENTISYGVLVPGDDVPDGVPFVRAQDLCLRDHPVRPNKSIAAEIEKPYARTRLTGGEILLCVVGSIGKLGVVPDSWAGANIARAVARIRPIPEVVRDYLLIVLQEDSVQSYFRSTTRTLAQPTLNVGMIEQTPIPLPPLAEQRRIVAKVKELISMVDKLEAQLAQSRSTASALMNAVVSELAASA